MVGNGVGEGREKGWGKYGKVLFGKDGGTNKFTWSKFE